MIIVFAVLCFVCAIGILFWGLGTANEFEYEAKKIEKWAKIVCGFPGVGKSMMASMFIKG